MTFASLTVRGTEASFQDRVVVVNGQTLATAKAAPAQGFLETETSFCTHDRQRFLDEPLQFAVQSAEASVVERVACKFAKTPGDFEQVRVALEVDGTVTADFGNDPRGPTACNPGFGGCSPDNFP